MRRILVTNDDGTSRRASRRWPTRSRRWARSPSSRRDRGQRDRPRADAPPPASARADRDGVYSVDGTPTDCVNIAIDEVLEGAGSRRVRHQQGLNIGDDVTYSGTVAGALEGALLGVSGDRGVAAVHARRVGLRARRRARPRRSPRPCSSSPLPPRTFLNINVPQGAAAGRRVTVQAKRNHVTKVDRAARPARAAVLLDRGSAGRLGAARSVRLPGHPGRLGLGDAAAARSDRPRRARVVEELTSKAVGTFHAAP